jgi:hypothetical protein
MTREVLQQALEALEDISAHEGITKQGSIAITAIKAVLAQPEQKPVAWPTMPPSIGQSPVLFESGYDEGWAKCMSMCKAAMTSPPKREWVELTNEDVVDCLGEPSWDEVVRKAEAKLKEKNA